MSAPIYSAVRAIETHIANARAIVSYVRLIEYVHTGTVKRAVVWAVDVDWIWDVWRGTIDTCPASVTYAGAIEASSSSSTTVVCKQVPNILPAQCCVEIQRIGRRLFTS